MNYINVCNENAISVLDQMREHGHLPCFCQIQKANISAPTQRRKTLKATITIEVDADTFSNPQQILRNFGGFVVLGVAPENLTDEYR